MFGSSYGIQGLTTNPFALQQLQGQPFANVPSSPAAGFSQYGTHPLQQVLQQLHVLPHQLQQLQHQQQQQLQQVLHLLQAIPPQLWQLQQLIQFLPQQIQQMQQPAPFQQSFGQGLGIGGFSPAPVGPQIFGTQPGQVM